MAAYKLTTLTSLFCLMALIGYSHGAESLGEVLMVGTSGNTITTVLGCMERLVCEGEGTNIVWRIARTRVDLTNSTNRLITISRNGNIVTSHLIFTDVMPEHSETYVCNIINEATRRTLTLSATLTVNNTFVYIAQPDNIDISNNTVGDTIPIGCSFQTCAQSIEVSILKGSQTLSVPRTTTDNVVLLNHDLDIREDTADMYACAVRLNGELFTQRFNITGTPQTPPTTPPDSSTMGGGSPTTKKNSSSPVYRTHYPILFTLVLLAVSTISKL